jgi:hypothetical protein
MLAAYSIKSADQVVSTVIKSVFFLLGFGLL